MKALSKKMDNAEYADLATIVQPKPRKYFAQEIAPGLLIFQLLVLAQGIEFVLNVLLQPLQPP
jgi:hypothetical protein